MPNLEISKIKLGNQTYDIKDEVARLAIGEGGDIESRLAEKFGWADYRTVTEGSGSSAVTKHYIYFYKNEDSAPSSSTVPTSSQYLCRIDAADFVKDGMVSSVAISNGKLIVTWNSDSGISPTEIALTDIFNPNNYYTKTASDAKFVTSVGYDTTNGKATYTVNGTTQTAFTPVTSPSNNSKELITSGGVYTALSTKAEKSELTINNGSSADKKVIQLKNGVSQEVLIAHQDISGKLDVFSNDSTNWDVTPSPNSTNAVTSGGLYTLFDDFATSINNALANAVTNVSYNSSTRTISKTIGSTTSGVVILPTATYNSSTETLELVLASTPS